MPDGRRGPRRPHARSTDLAFLLMIGAHAAPLLAGAVYVLVLDIEGRIKGAVAFSALSIVAALIALMVYVAIHPLVRARPSTAD